MAIKRIIQRLRRAEHEIDEAKMELATENVDGDRDARLLKRRLDRLETQVSIMKGTS